MTRDAASSSSAARDMAACTLKKCQASRALTQCIGCKHGTYQAGSSECYCQQEAHGDVATGIELSSKPCCDCCTEVVTSTACYSAVPLGPATPDVAAARTVFAHFDKQNNCH